MGHRTAFIDHLLQQAAMPISAISVRHFPHSWSLSHLASRKAMLPRNVRLQNDDIRFQGQRMRKRFSASLPVCKASSI